MLLDFLRKAGSATCACVACGIYGLQQLLKLSLNQLRALLMAHYFSRHPPPFKQQRAAILLYPPNGGWGLNSYRFIFDREVMQVPRTFLAGPAKKVESESPSCFGTTHPNLACRVAEFSSRPPRVWLISLDARTCRVSWIPYPTGGLFSAPDCSPSPPFRRPELFPDS